MKNIPHFIEDITQVLKNAIEWAKPVNGLNRHSDTTKHLKMLKINLKAWMTVFEIMKICINKGDKMSKVKMGIIGVGGIANNVHIPEIQKSNDGEVIAICDINESVLKETGDKLNIPEHLRFADYRDLIDCELVEAIEICTPNYLHIPMAIYAAKANKPFHVEKPLSVSYEAAKPLEELLKEKNIPNMMSFSYRFKPAVRYAKWILEKGLIGNVLSVNVEYLKSTAFMEGRRLDWRFVKEYAGTGVLGDLGVHLIDMSEFLIGDFEAVSATSGIVVKERKKLDSEEIAKVETDDYCNFLAKIKGGVAGNYNNKVRARSCKYNKI